MYIVELKNPCIPTGSRTTHRVNWAPQDAIRMNRNPGQLSFVTFEGFACRIFIQEAPPLE